MRRNANRRQALTLVLLAALVAMLVPARSTLADEDKSPSTIQIAFDSSAGYNSVEDVREAFRNPNVSRVVALDKTLVYTMPAEASSLLFTIKNARENGLLTSVNYHSIVDGQPWMAVGMSQFKGPKNSYSCDVPVSADLVSAAVGFDVTASESLNVAAEAWVPQTAGEKTVSSMRLTSTPVYAYYSYDVYFGQNRIATGTAKRLVGACFQRGFAYRFDD